MTFEYPEKFPFGHEYFRTISDTPPALYSGCLGSRASGHVTILSSWVSTVTGLAGALISWVGKLEQWGIRLNKQKFIELYFSNSMLLNTSVIPRLQFL